MNAEILYPTQCGQCDEILNPGTYPTDANLEVICRDH